MIGATRTPTGTPAACSAPIAWMRRCGALARGSSLAARRLSSELTETSTRTSPSRAIGARMSRSRSTSAFLVTMVQGWWHSASSSSAARVSRQRFSTGWYGSVLLPMLIGLTT